MRKWSCAFENGLVLLRMGAGQDRRRVLYLCIAGAAQSSASSEALSGLTLSCCVASEICHMLSSFVT
eukprot:2519644-Amphidinium_carterae.1